MCVIYSKQKNSLKLFWLPTCPKSCIKGPPEGRRWGGASQSPSSWWTHEGDGCPPLLSVPPEWALPLALAAVSTKTVLEGVGALLCSPLVNHEGLLGHDIRGRLLLALGDLAPAGERGLALSSLSADPGSRGAQSKGFVRRTHAFSVLVGKSSPGQTACAGAVPENHHQRAHTAAGCWGARLASAQGQFISRLVFIFVLFCFTVFKAISHLKIEFPQTAAVPGSG